MRNGNLPSESCTGRTRGTAHDRKREWEAPLYQTHTAGLCTVLWFSQYSKSLNGFKKTNTYLCNLVFMKYYSVEFSLYICINII